MISNLDKLISDYKNNPNDETKQVLINNIITLDKEKTKNYLEEIQKIEKYQPNIILEQDRLQKIVLILTKRKEDRVILENIIDELSLNITLDNIPNIEKITALSNKLKVIEIINNITNKLNKNNLNKAIDILNKQEFKIVLLEFSLIKEDSKEEIERYLKSLLNNNNLKILEYYNNSKEYFPNINIPNMGLEKIDNEVKIDSDIFN